MGDSIASNLFLLGFAWKRGLVPGSAAAVERAIELNGVAVETNLAALRWGRAWAVDPAAVERAAGLPGVVSSAKVIDRLIPAAEAVGR